MKKTYIAPEMEMVNIETVNMIAASDPKVYSTPVSPSSAGIKGLGDWDEEDDVNLW